MNIKDIVYVNRPHYSKFLKVVFYNFHLDHFWILFQWLLVDQHYSSRELWFWRGVLLVDSFNKSQVFPFFTANMSFSLKLLTVNRWQLRCRPSSFQWSKVEWDLEFDASPLKIKKNASYFTSKLFPFSRYLNFCLNFLVM